MWLGLDVLKYSIQKYASKPVNIIEMNYAGDDPNWHGWDMGREIGVPATRTKNPKTGGDVWFTDFSSFRYYIPEANNFEGKAIYLDFDQVVRGDIIELFEREMNDFPILSLTPHETSVMLMDCEKFKDKSWWLYGDKMKQSGLNPPLYNHVLQQQNQIGQLPHVWNCLDGQGFHSGTRLIHYTDMSRQPHRPYPEKLKYRRHSWVCETAWFDIFYEMLDSGLIDMERLANEKAFLFYERQVAEGYERKPIHEA